MSRFYAEGEVYNVLAERPDAPGAADNPEWFEYRVRLCRSADRATVAEWDSFDEGFNGQDRLSQSEAETALVEVANEVRDGKAADWFTIPPGAETPTPGGNLQYQPDIVLEPAAVADAIHGVFALEYASVIEDAVQEGRVDRALLSPAGGSLAEWAPRQNPADVLPIAWYLIGRIQQAWDYPVGLVFHHAGITSLADQAHALGDLCLGCVGHGVTLADDYEEHISRAEGVLRAAFDLSPIYWEPCCLRALAEDAVRKAVRKAKREAAAKIKRRII